MNVDLKQQAVGAEAAVIPDSPLSSNRPYLLASIIGCLGGELRFKSIGFCPYTTKVELRPVNEGAMCNLFFLLATNFLALVCLASAFAKTIQKPDPFSSNQHWVLAIAHARWFPLIEFGIGTMLIFPLPMILQACAAIAVASVVGAGLYLRVVHAEEEYEGFGSITPSSQGQYFALGVAVIGATALVTFKALQTPFVESPVNWWVTGTAIALLILIAGKLRHDQTSGKGYAKKCIDLAKVSELPRNLFLGADNRGALTAGELVANGKPSVILAVSPHCTECRDAYAVLANHAKLLSKTLTIVVIAQNDELFRTTPEAPMRQLIDPASHLNRFLGLRTLPYAILVNDDLTLLAPPSQTSHTVQRLITLLVVMIENAPDTYLT